VGKAKLLENTPEAHLRRKPRTKNPLEIAVGHSHYEFIKRLEARRRIADKIPKSGGQLGKFG
jgi:hypothetical protein